MLEEGVSDHRHERVTMEALPGSALEVVETKFLLQLLVGLLANPSRLDARRQGGQPVRGAAAVRHKCDDEHVSVAKVAERERFESAVSSLQAACGWR
jgi:hypothetical protein